MARQVLAVQAGQEVLPELLGLVWVLLQAGLMRVALVLTATGQTSVAAVGQVVPRLGMGFREPLDQALAVAVAVAGDQVEAFIAVAELGLTTVQMVDLLVLQGLMHITVPLLVIGLMPSQTHCYACAMG